MSQPDLIPPASTSQPCHPFRIHHQTRLALDLERAPPIPVPRSRGEARRPCFCLAQAFPEACRSALPGLLISPSATFRVLPPPITRQEFRSLRLSTAMQLSAPAP